MQLDLLPDRSASAAVNMATDFLLLQPYPAAEHARFRAYGWQRPAVTFGFSQKIAWVRDHLPTGFDGELCRRPSGGGIVDHRLDWTYALVIPRGALLYDERAVESYRLVHTALAAALAAGGAEAVVKNACQPAGDSTCAPGPGVCFQRAELYDVVHPGASGLETKLAGAAQKRAKRGLLFQGSVDRGAVEQVAGGAFDWETLAARFTARLADLLEAEATPTAWPDLDEAIDQLAEQYATPEWIEYR